MTMLDADMAEQALRLILELKGEIESQKHLAEYYKSQLDAAKAAANGD